MRWLAVATILVVGLLYYRPLKSYLDTKASLEERAAQVRSLRAERDELARQVAESDTPEALARRARRLGLVKPGERLFIVRRSCASATKSSARPIGPHWQNRPCNTAP